MAAPCHRYLAADPASAVVNVNREMKAITRIAATNFLTIRCPLLSDDSCNFILLDGEGRGVIH
jgi:hypothetical protein